MATDNILKLKVENKTKHLEKYIRPQWTWKTYLFIFALISSLIFVTIDLEINFVELFTDSSKYFGDIFNRMVPPDFSNFNNLISAMFETIEIAFRNFYCDNFINTGRIIFGSKFSSKLFCFSYRENNNNFL